MITRGSWKSDPGGFEETSRTHSASSKPLCGPVTWGNACMKWGRAFGSRVAPSTGPLVVFRPPLLGILDTGREGLRANLATPQTEPVVAHFVNLQLRYS